jgi:hypothetical protein
MKEFPFPEEVVLRVLEEDGWNEIIKVRANYTGKGMHKACVGFEAPEVRNVAAFLVRLAGETEAEGVELEDLVDVTCTMCSDNMGKNNVIVYFPGCDKFAEQYVNAEDTDAEWPAVSDESVDMSAAGRMFGTLLGDPYDNEGHEDEARRIALRGIN